MRNRVRGNDYAIAAYYFRKMAKLMGEEQAREWYESMKALIDNRHASKTKDRSVGPRPAA